MLAVKIIFILMVISVPGMVISAFMKRAAQRRNSEEIYSQPVELSPVETTDAVVVSKNCRMEKGGGSRQPSHEIIYTVTFFTDSNDTVQYAVPEEIYERLSVGEKGTLATTEGVFFDFC